jgi:hypothetical protein
MIMGHTIQTDGYLSSRCNGRIVLIDVGISRAFGKFGGRCGVLEISENGKMSGLYCPDEAHKIHRKPGVSFVRLPLNADPQSRFMHMFPDDTS